MPNPYAVYTTAGQEVSSTYEGRHITLPESYLNHPVHGDNLVDGKDPVTFGAVADGYGVGVAFSSAITANDIIAIDTEGIWALNVYAIDDEGASAIRIGDIIFINRTTCVLSKISSDTTNLVFGYALTTADGDGYSHVIVVKVHWDPWYDVFRDYTGTGSEDALIIDVDDASTGTPYNRGLHVNYRNTADKAATSEIDGIGVDMSLTQNVHYAYPYSAYVGTSGDPNITYIAGFSSYIDDVGTGTVSTVYGIDNQLNMVHAPTQSAFMRCRSHGGTPDIVLLLAGSPCANYFVQGDNQDPFRKGAHGGADNAFLRCYFDGAEYRIPLYS